MDNSDSKDSKLMNMPDRNGEELASAVARALRSTGRSEEAFQANEEISPSTGVNSMEFETASSAGSNINGEILLHEIVESPFQTRENFEAKDLSNLAESIELKGVLQPVIVRKIAVGYELVAGERRLRAAKQAGLETIPAVIKELNDQEAVECSIIETAQREDLNPIEEAKAFQMLNDHFGLNQSEIATAVGKNRATISNCLRLLQLDETIIEMLEEGILSAGHGRALLSADVEQQLRLAHKTIQQNLSVRALEDLIRESKEGHSEELYDENQEKIEATLRRLESKISRLTEIEDVRVSIDAQGRKKLGFVFETDSSFKRFVSKLR